MFLSTNEPCCEKVCLPSFLTRSDTKRAVQPENMARGLKFRIKEEEVMYYKYSEIKGADQLRGYHAASFRAADLSLCFCKCKKQVIS